MTWEYENEWKYENIDQDEAKTHILMLVSGCLFCH